MSTKHSFIALLVLAACGDSTGPSHVAEDVVSYTLQYETDWLDLDTGTIESCDIVCGSPYDLKIAYNALSAVHAVVLHNEFSGGMIAHLPGRAFSGVQLADTAGAGFTADIVADPFDAGRTILYVSDAGHVYKLGNLVELASESSVRFDVVRLD